ncbi:MAG: hypothetical protein IPJ07_11445 [Acidobacteria bacterium]|nr:hypothetical protein [Acidobacteriota bacterium]
MHRDIDISAGSFKGHSVPKPTLTITGDRWSFKFPPPYDRNPHTVTGTYTLSPNINPKGIDLIKGKQISRSLYIVRGDILTICYGLNDVTERPKSFDNCISDGLIVISYKKLPAK